MGLVVCGHHPSPPRACAGVAVAMGAMPSMMMATTVVMSFFMMVSFSEWLGVVVAGEFVDCVFQKLFGNALIKF